MAKADIERDFPALIGLDYGISDPDFNYNCLAYVLGDQSRWWEPPNGGGRYWPPGYSPDASLPTVERIIRDHGYTVEISRDDSPLADAIAIFADGNEWSHFAIFRGGTWSSKLGEGNDVVGVPPPRFEKTIYGEIFKILSRPAVPKAGSPKPPSQPQVRSARTKRERRH